MTGVLDTPTAAGWRANELRPLVDAVRAGIAVCPTATSAALVSADCLRQHAPGVDILTPEEQLGSAEHYQQHVLHVDRETGFSVVALVWRAGQQTTIHDHRCWGAVTVLRGEEEETLYASVPRLFGARLVELRRRVNPVGSVASFAPPGDVHYVRNPGPDTAISLHIYGGDITATTSIRRSYPEKLVTRA